MKSLETREVQLHLREVQKKWEDRRVGWEDKAHDEDFIGAFTGNDAKEVIEAIATARASIALLLDSQKTILADLKNQQETEK